MQVESNLDNSSDGDVALTDVLRFIGRHVVLISAVAVVGGIAGFGVSRIAPQVWEGTSIVMIGRVGNELIEPPPNAVERVGTAGFAQRVVSAAGTPVREDMLRASLRAAPRGTDLVAISVRGPTSEDAARYATVARDVMLQAQNDKILDAEARLRSDAASAERALERAVKQQDSWSVYMKGVADGAVKPQLAEVLILKDMIDRTDAQIDDARKKSEKLQRSLRPTETYASQAIDDGAPLVTKVSAGRIKFVAGGLILGVLLGLLCAVGLDLRASARRKSGAR